MIELYNRKTKKYDIEKVAGNEFLKILYSTKMGRLNLNILFKRKLFSTLAGIFCDMKISRKRIKKFVKDFNINMNESLNNIDSFNTFNEFFTRKLKDNSRTYIKDKNIFISPGDGRLKVWDNIDINKIVQIKGKDYKLAELINNENLAKEYKNGVCILLRLAPVDYHRFHFIDDGSCSKTNLIDGFYYSVNPIALTEIVDVFCRNKREFCLFKSDNFGEVLYVEVGATSVGSIVQTYKENIRVRKGEEKGYFKFGGSTIILFVKKETIIIDKDIIEQTLQGFETKVNSGESIGEKFYRKK